MATFPPTVSLPGTPAPGGAPTPGTSAGTTGTGAAGGSFVKLAMLSQVIQSLAQEFPGSDHAISLMMQGLRELQGAATAQSAQPQAAAPPL